MTRVSDGTAASPANAGGVASGPGRATIAASALRGSTWTLAGYAGAQVLRLASNLALTRLLFPAVFGQMALVGIFIQGLAMFSDIGIGPAIVQSARGEDPRFLRTAWTIQFVRGVVLWLCSFALGRLAAAFYAQPLLVWLVPAAGFNAVVAGLEATSVHTLQRKLRLERVTLLDLMAQATGVVVTLALALGDRALHGANDPAAVWAIVGGGFATTVTRAVLSHRLLDGIRHRFLFERDAARALFRFGRWIFVSTLLTFLAGQSDRLVFGKLVPIEVLGVYGIALMLATMPTQVILRLGGAVVFPTYSRLADESDFSLLFTKVRLPLLLGGGAIVSALVACGPGLIRLLYDPRYAEAGWMLQFLACMAWFQILECTNGAALLARGQVRWVAAGNGAKFLALAVLVPLGFRAAGFPGALSAVVTADALRYLTSAIAAARSGLRGFRLDGVLTAVVAATASIGAAVGHAVETLARGSDLAGAAAAGAASAVLWAAIGAWYLARMRPRLSRGVKEAGDATAR